MNTWKITLMVVLRVLVTTFICLLMGVGSAAAEKGEATFNKNKCGDCHQTKGPAKEKTFADQLKKKGPELWYAGSKLQPDWLEGWLAKPTIIRPLKYNSPKEKNPGKHPALSKNDAKDVASYLATLTSKNVKVGLIKPKNSPRAKLDFTKKLGCIGCHTIQNRGKKFGGLSGPNLANAGKRIKGDWIYAYLKEPKVFKPVKRMPIFTGIIGEASMKSIAAFVSSQGTKKKK